MKKCLDFELDKTVYCNGDCEDCNVCKWNNKATDTCMLGND